MSTTQEAVVRRFYEEMCTGRHNEIANELFTDDCSCTTRRSRQVTVLRAWSR